MHNTYINGQTNAKGSDVSDDEKLLRKRISDAVHHAVCEFTGSDGLGHCVFYALAGSLLATHVFQKQYAPQAGALFIVGDPGSDRTIAIVPENDGFHRGEFHCWFAHAEENDPGQTTVAKEIIDLTSRHYRTYAEQSLCIEDYEQSEGGTVLTLAAESERPQWTRPDPPEFVWADDGEFPDLMKVVPDRESTSFLGKVFNDSIEDIRQLFSLALAHFKETSEGIADVRSTKRTSTICPTQNRHRKIGRNERCPCGSGKKFKKCCLNKAGTGESSSRRCCSTLHRWVVFSTALTEGWLMLNCTECGAMGTVNDPSADEWGDAHSAPSKPYDWSDNSRVTFRQSGPVYVSRDPRSTGKILVPKQPLRDEEHKELNVLKEVVIKAELNGKMFPLYIGGCADHVAYEPSEVVKQLAANIQALVDRGRMFTPAMMAIVIREYVRESRPHWNG